MSTDIIVNVIGEKDVLNLTKAYSQQTKELDLLAKKNSALSQISTGLQNQLKKTNTTVDSLSQKYKELNLKVRGLEQAYIQLEKSNKKLISSAKQAADAVAKSGGSFSRAAAMGQRYLPTLKKVQTSNEQLIVSTTRLMASQGIMETGIKRLTLSTMTQEGVLSGLNSVMSAQAGLQAELILLDHAEYQAELRVNAAIAESIAFRKAQIVEEERQVAAQGRLAAALTATGTATATQTAAMAALGTSAGKAGTAVGKGNVPINRMMGIMPKVAESTTTASKAAATMALSQTTLNGALRGAAGALGGLWMSYGAVLPLMVTFAAVASSIAVIKIGAQFEYTTKYMDALAESSGGATSALAEVRDGLREFEGLRSNVNELALAMKEFSKAGVDAATGLENVAEMSRFAVVAEMELSSATALIIGQANAFGVSYADAANMITAAATSSATSINEMANAMSYTTELGSVSKVTFDEVSTAMAVLANQGIRGCYDRDTDVLTKDGWKKWEDVTYDDRFATYNAKSGELEYQKPERLVRYKHTGPMYRIANKGIDLCVTPDHKMFVKKIDRDSFETIKAEDVAGKHVRYKTGGIGWVGENPDVITLPGFAQSRGSWTKHVEPVDIDAKTWATFLGWYIAEGHCNYNKGSYRVVITQKKPKHLAKMRKVFSKLPWAFDYTKSTGQFRFNSEQLTRALKPLGKVYEKHIPHYAKQWGQRLLTLLYAALMEGDGDQEGKYYTSSKRLRDDVQEICLKLGYSTLYRKTRSEGDTSSFTGGRQIVARADGWLVSVTSKRTEPWNDPGSSRGKHGERRVAGSAYDLYEGWVDYDDEVFCAEVPNGLLIVRRNGRAVISGNSKAGTALRTSIVRMQAPTTKLQKMFDKLNISWSAFTEDGKVKSMATMFRELESATAGIADRDRVELMKELFGLRAMKAGSNLLKEISGEWDELNEHVKGSVEGMTLLQKISESLDDTAVARWEKFSVTSHNLMESWSQSRVVKTAVSAFTAILEGADKLTHPIKQSHDLTVAVQNLWAALNAEDWEKTKFVSTIDTFGQFQEAASVLGEPFKEAEGYTKSFLLEQQALGAVLEKDSWHTNALYIKNYSKTVKEAIGETEKSWQLLNAAKGSQVADDSWEHNAKYALQNAEAIERAAKAVIEYDKRMSELNNSLSVSSPYSVFQTPSADQAELARPMTLEKSEALDAEIKEQFAFIAEATKEANEKMLAESKALNEKRRGVSTSYTHFQHSQVNTQYDHEKYLIEYKLKNLAEELKVNYNTSSLISQSREMMYAKLQTFSKMYSSKEQENLKGMEDSWMKLAKLKKVDIETSKKQQAAIQKFNVSMQQMLNDSSNESTYVRLLRDIDIEIEENLASLAKYHGVRSQVYLDAQAQAEEVKQHLLENDTELLRSSNNLANGVKAAYLDMVSSAMTWGEVGYEVFTATKDAGVEFVSSLVLQTASLSEAWDTMWNSMKTAAINAISEIAVEWAIKGIGNMIMGSGSSSSSSSSSSSGGGTISTTLSKIPVVGGVLGGAASFLGFSEGGVLNAQGLGAYSNSIVTKPTVFPFAEGGAIGLMGEAGKEAILPVTEMGGGQLGVNAVVGSGGDAKALEDNTEALEYVNGASEALKEATEGATGVSVVHTEAVNAQKAATEMATTANTMATQTEAINTTATTASTAATKENSGMMSSLTGALSRGWSSVKTGFSNVVDHVTNKFDDVVTGITDSSTITKVGLGLLTAAVPAAGLMVTGAVGANIKEEAAETAVRDAEMKAKLSELSAMQKSFSSEMRSMSLGGGDSDSGSGSDRGTGSDASGSGTGSRGKGDGGTDGIGGYATGGSHSGGWRWVGERGPELEFTGPSQIVSNANSKKLLEQANQAAANDDLPAVKSYLLAIAQTSKATVKALNQLERLIRNNSLGVTA